MCDSTNSNILRAMNTDKYLDIEKTNIKIDQINNYIYNVFLTYKTWLELLTRQQK